MKYNPSGSNHPPASMISKILHLGNATPLPHPLRVTPQTSVASLTIRTTCTPVLVHVRSIIPGLETRMEINARACPGWIDGCP